MLRACYVSVKDMNNEDEQRPPIEGAIIAIEDNGTITGIPIEIGDN